MKAGKKEDERRKMYGDRFGLSYNRRIHHLPKVLLDQLDRCKDDEARRIILRVSK